MKMMVIEIKLLIIKYLDEIKPYLINVILNNLRKWNTLKIQLIMAINFLSSKDIDEEHVMYSKADSIEITIYDKAD